MRTRKPRWFLVCRLDVEVCPKRLPKRLCFSLPTGPPSSRVRPSLSMAENWPANSRSNSKKCKTKQIGTIMKMTGNTIFITGGGSGIGRGLAEAFHKHGNKVIISGRWRANLDAVTTANPGMAAIELDITDPASIDKVAAKLIRDYPGLNVVI